MKYYKLLFALCFVFAIGCSVNGSKSNHEHSHGEESHTHEHDDQSHGQGDDVHQEEFTIEDDSAETGPGEVHMHEDGTSHHNH